MASWKKHFKIWDPQDEKPNSGNRHGTTSSSKFSSWLQDVYTGMPNRVERYAQYDQMDQDSEVNAALDTIAEFCTQFDPVTNLPFAIKWRDNPTDSETKIVNDSIKKWTAINKFDSRIFRIVRSTLKYGDHFFMRDPETYELYWVDPKEVIRAVINEVEGREIEQYVIGNVHPNFANKVATKPVENVTTIAGASLASHTAAGAYSRTQSGTQKGQEIAIKGADVVHITLNDGLDASWPFGASILDSIFKIYKQKEMLEDAVLIYRVQRAPERRVFYIDTGNLPEHQAMAFLERVKNEIHQRRIPTRTGGGTTMDASYSPLSIMEDFFFATTADGRGSKVETLPGGTGLGEIDDLKYFNNKMLRGLRIPSSYLPTGPDDSAVAYSDGRVGTAMIQEYRFNRYCMRLQGLISPFLDKEFKMFMKNRGVNIDSSSFTLDFIEPQNFSSYREVEINAARAGVFTQLAEIPYISHRFKLAKYLGFTDDELIENQRMWKEENLDAEEAIAGEEEAGFGAAGIAGPNDTDLDLSGSMDAPGEESIEGPGDMPSSEEGAASPLTAQPMAGPGA